MDYPPEFLQLWNNRPRRIGTDSKQDAWKAVKARLKQGFTYEVMQAGLTRYLRYCVNSGIIKTPYVMQTSRFFGPGCHFENDWELAKEEHWSDEAFG